MTHPRVDIPLIICPCSLLAAYRATAGGTLWTAAPHAFSSPAHLRHSSLTLLLGAVPSALLSSSPRWLRGKQGPELSLGVNFTMTGHNRVAYLHLH